MKINHGNLFGPVLFVLPYRQSIQNLNGEIGPSTLTKSSSHHNLTFDRSDVFQSDKVHLKA